MARMSYSETMDRLLLLIRSGHPVIYVVSHEESRVFDNIARLFRVLKHSDPNKHLLRWQEGAGLVDWQGLTAHPSMDPGPWLDIDGASAGGARASLTAADDPGMSDPSVVWDSIRKAGVTQNIPELKDSVAVFSDVHPWIQTDGQGLAGPLVRPLRNAADDLRRYYELHRADPDQPYKTLIIVAPTAERLSGELDRDVISLDFPAPEQDELLRLLDQLTNQGLLRFPENPSPKQIEAVLGDEDVAADDIPQRYRERLSLLIAGAGRGLTLEDFRLGLNGFAVDGRPLTAQHVEHMLDLKAKVINSRALEYTPHVEVKLGGLKKETDWLKVRQAAAVSSSVREQYHLPTLKGVLLCGVAGGGKSQLAKLIASQFNLALLRLDVGALFGSYVGESEQRTREALQLAEALAPVVLWIDEIDKAFSGAAGGGGDGGGGDGGVSARVLGHFLTWLAEKTDTVFVVATANNAKLLCGAYPEFSRKGRFDQVFWVDLPDQEGRTEIFRIYLQPHVDAGYLNLSADEVQEIAETETPGQVQVGDDVLGAFCKVLGHDNVSITMTGAEIEYAVQDALFEAHARDSDRAADKFTASLICNRVKIAKSAALYRAGGPKVADLTAQRTYARDQGWIGAV